MTLHNKHKNSPLNQNDQPFALQQILRAVLEADILNMGVDTILRRIAAKCQDSSKARDLGLEDTLGAYHQAVAIYKRAGSDKLAFAELKLLCTTLNALLADVVENHPEMAAPFIRADVSWPVNEPYYKPGKGTSAIDRVRELGLGANAKAGGMRNFGSVFALFAMVLHLFLLLNELFRGARKAAAAASAERNGESALKKWHGPARAAVERAFGKWSRLPLNEVDHIVATRNIEPHRQGDVREVSGDVRQVVKKPFLNLAGFAEGLINLGRSDAQDLG